MFTCTDGWHVVERAAGLLYVRVAIRLRDEHGTYVYLIGSAPDDSVCQTIWCYGPSGTPWTCSACGEAISARVYDPFRPWGQHSFRKALVDPFLYWVDLEQCLPISVRRAHATLAMRAYYARLEQSSVTDPSGAWRDE